MKLTLKELQKSMQEQIDTMNIQLQKSRREEYELHERADSFVLNIKGFRQETAFNFRELRAEFLGELGATRGEVAQLKIDVAELKVDVAQLKVDVAELKVDVRELKADMADLKLGFSRLQDEMRAGFSAILGYAGRIDVDHEARIAALEAKNSH